MKVVSVRTNSIVRGSLSPKYGVEVELQQHNKSGKKCQQQRQSKCQREESFADDSISTDPSSPEIARLQREFPTLIREEVQRFWEDHQDDDDTDDAGALMDAVREHLQQFVEWRKMYGLDGKPQQRDTVVSFEKDREDWKAAWNMMWDREEQGLDIFPPCKDAKQTNNKKSSKSYARKEIPQYFFCYASQDDPNQIMLQLLPARIAAYCASPEQHSLAVQLYLECRFDRSNPHQKATLCLDCRGSPGWTNANVFQLQPIISASTHALVRYHPRRLEGIVIFPVPRLAVSLFEMIKKALPPVVQQRTLLVSGSERNCNLPKMAEKGNVPLALLERMEATREQVVAEKY